MPHANEFLLGFGFRQNSTVAGFTLISAAASEQTVQRYQEYSYRLQLIYRGTGDFNTLYHAVLRQVSTPHIIYGVRNPYRCTIDTPQHGSVTRSGNDIYFELTGHAHRSN